MKLLTHNTKCRICRGTNLSKVLSFGPTPLANAFLESGDSRAVEQYFPLDVHLCKDCSLLQLLDVVSPAVLFKDYVYVSSTSPVFVTHFEHFAEEVFARPGLGLHPLVIDIGSNDGILLRPFQRLGAKVLGIEPDASIAAIARKRGVKTVSRFFSSKLAAEILKRYGQADIITATNVFAHINDIHAVARGVQKLLKRDGIFIIEAPYVRDFLEKNLFDTVYHEHLSYFSVTALAHFFKRAGMKLIDVQKVDTHGGSIRVFASRADASHQPSRAVDSFILDEKRLRLCEVETYRRYVGRILDNRAKLIALLTSLKQKGKRIAGYGAPAKGNTLLNFFAIGNDLIEYIVDDSVHKQGKLTPGKRIPIVSPEVLRLDPPDYLLIMAWNFAESIMQKNKQFVKNGGEFIIPIPAPGIVVPSPLSKRALRRASV